ESYLSSSISVFVNSNHIYMLGPSQDGGFYIFGGKDKLDKSIWCEVEYSTNDTCKQLKSLLDKKSETLITNEHFDIDEKKDFDNIKSIDKEDLTLKQKELFLWMKSHN
ncbi:hypothetical protein N9B72_00165, partial [Bacteriovoracaceae bacterium]|nr:hypothetical protein [Bacteriovoracaceae bacterium]